MNTPIEYLRESITRSLNGIRPPSLMLALAENILAMLEELAAEEGREMEEMAAELLAEAVTTRYQNTNENIKHWETLSGREQEVAALMCMGYTNPQIAARCNISIETVKTHVSSILQKFEVKGRHQLAYILRRWDFSAFDGSTQGEAPPPPS